jgi:hypothetical protein
VISNDRGIFSLVRRSLDGNQTILCLVNVTPEACSLRPGLDHWLPAHSTWQDLIGGQSFAATSSGLQITLKPYQSCWFSMTDE